MAEKQNSNTGPYPYRDKKTIEDSSIDCLKRQKSFKGAKFTDSEWLKKKNAVRQDIDPFYSWDSPGEPR